MPYEAAPGFFNGVPYFFQVLSGRARHQRAIRQLEREISAEERRLTEALRALGRRVSESSQPPDAATLAMSGLRDIEEHRAAAGRAQTDLEQQQASSEQSFAATEAECSRRSAAAQAEVQQIQTELNEAEAKLRQVSSRLAEEEKQIRVLTKQRNDKREQATKTQDAAQQEVLQRTVADLGVQIGDWEKQRESASAEAETIKPVIAERQAALQQAKARLAETQQALAAARQDLANTKRQVVQAQRQQSAELARLDRELEQKLLEVGQSVDASRDGAEAFGEPLSQIDEIRGGMQQRQAQVAHLSAERDRYDRAAFKNGLIVLVGGTVILLVGLLVLVLAL